MNFLYRLSIDRISSDYLSGWCYNRLNKHKTVDLEVRRGNEVIGAASASLFREDLLKLSIHPTGQCGFELIFHSREKEQAAQPIALFVKGSKTPLTSIYPDQTVHLKKSGIADCFQKVRTSLYKERPPVLFMHIPKTAGTSFNTLAHSLFPINKVVTHIELLSETERSLLPGKFRFISGHLRLRDLKKLAIDHRPSLYSIVREPYAQLHSHLKWLIQTATDTSDNYFKHRNPIIHELGKSLCNIDFSKKEQLAAFSQEISGVGIAFFDNLQTRYFCEAGDRELITECHLQQAIANTKLFSVIGLTEHYEDYVKNFIQLNDCKHDVSLETMNQSRTPPLFDLTDDTVRAALLPVVRYDIELYNYIRANCQHN